MLLLAAIGLLAGVAVLMLLLGRRYPRRARPPWLRPRRTLPWWAQVLATLTALIVAFAVFQALRSLEGSGSQSTVREPLQSPSDGRPATMPQPATDGDGPWAWAAALAAAAGAALAVTAVVLLRGPARPDTFVPRPFHRRIRQLVADTIDELRRERDPRRAIVAAYARMEHDLASHGLPRRPAEAPMEYLRRLLAQLDVSARSAARLTDLFERAKFSQHPVDHAMKEQAIGALVAVASELEGGE